MGRLIMRNVKQMPNGALYFRRKIAGKDTYIRLPAVDDPTFAEEYRRLSEPDSGAPERAKVIPRSLAALVIAYKESAEFRGLTSTATIRNYHRYLDMIAAEHGHRLVAQIRPKHVYTIRDRMVDNPGKANNWLSIFRNIMNHATRLDWRADNPAAGVKPLPIGEHEPWPADLLRVCLEVASPMTRLLVVTGLCSGQRNGDVIRMQWGWINDDIMEFTQSKTRVDVAIPMHPFWKEELSRHERRSVTLHYDRFGKPFSSPKAVQSRIRELMAMKPVKEVLADLVARETIREDATFVFHGLRKNACCYLLELGLNDSQVGSILGMSPEMVRHYGKRTRALMVARSVAASVSGGILVNLPGVQTNHMGRHGGK